MTDGSSLTGSVLAMHATPVKPPAIAARDPEASVPNAVDNLGHVAPIDTEQAARCNALDAVNTLKTAPDEDRVDRVRPQPYFRDRRGSPREAVAARLDRAHPRLYCVDGLIRGGRRW